MSFPYLARTSLKYKSPHATDLSFAKDETIRVTGPNPDDEDWLIGETLDGTRSGGFPKDFVIEIEGEEADQLIPETETSQPQPPALSAVSSPPLAAPPVSKAAATDPAPVPTTAPAPPSPKVDPVSLPTPSPAPSPAPAPAPATSTASAAADPDDPRPQSMKDRLAFFAAAQNKVAPPPVKPKFAATTGLTWSQRQKIRQEQEAKERETAGDVSSPAPVAAPVVPPTSQQSVPREVVKSEEKSEGSGMSASDALSSITKGQSLKERMAALQGAGAFGSPTEKPPPPAPSAKPKVWQRPPAPPQPEMDEESPESQGGEAKSVNDTTEEGGPVPESGDAEGEEEETEEEKEKARRAAIAARMAKLGGRGPMGMMPPAKPVRRPTRELSETSPSAEKVDPTPATEPVPEITYSEGGSVAIEPASSLPEESFVSTPTSIKVPAIPRRAAPPRRKGTAPAAPVTKSDDPISLEPQLAIDTSDPPPQVMVADEEKPLPRSQEELDLEKKQEEAASGLGGYEGAINAGIAMKPVEEDDDNGEDEVAEALIGAVGGADSASRGVGIVGSEDGKILVDAEPLKEIEDGMEEGGDEKDEIMEEAEKGDLNFEAPQEPEDIQETSRIAPIATVPLHSPAPSGTHIDEDEDEDTPPPPPPPRGGLGIGKDEIELKHEHEAEQAQEDEEEDEEEAPPPPPRRSASIDRPLGPRPPPSAPRSTSQQSISEAKALPPPPVGNPMIPPRDEDEEERELEGDGDEDEPEEDVAEEEEEEAPAPPPPRRQPSVPAIKTDVLAAPHLTAKPSSPVSPTISRSPIASGEAEASPTDAEETSRRSGIAARMAKLGGIKFGMPPPVFRKQSAQTGSIDEDNTPTSPIKEVPSSPPIPRSSSEVVNEEPGSAEVPDQEETQEDEATRKRATLARLRAGGALGFGMFNHGPASPSATNTDSRGLEAETESLSKADEEEDVPPPLPPVPAGRAPMASPTEVDDDDEAPPPPPPGRPPVPVSRPSLPPLTTDVPSTPSKSPRSPSDVASPATPTRTPSFGKRPPIPSVEKRLSMSANSRAPSTTIPEGRVLEAPPPSQSQGSDWQLADEPAVMAMDQDIGSSPPPPPGRQLPPIQTSQPPAPGSPTASPRRSMSSISRRSVDQTQTPVPQGMSPTRQPSRQSFEPSSRPSFSTGARPSYNDLQEASGVHGAKLIRAARGMFDQGKKGYYGDGSPAGFVLVAMDNAQMPRPQQSWGQIVFEQEAGSVLKRYDEPRPGDIAAFHDAKLKGKKGLSSYNQAVGSVEEPLVGIIAEFDSKNKHKLRVLQVERGAPEEVSYRLDDLKSGRVVVYRPGI